jgi:hypothetical protein
MKKKLTVPRVGQRYTEKEFEPIALAIGQAALAWNGLHQALAALFVTVTATEHHNLGYAIWHSSNLDRAARGMLEASLEEIPLRWPVGFPNAVSEIEWLLKRCNSLEDDRNNLIHAPLVMLGGKPKKRENYADKLARALVGEQPMRILPFSILGNKRAAKLEGKDLLTEYRWCRDTALVLRDYTMSLMAILKINVPGTWPERPREPNRGHKKSRQGRPRQPGKEPRQRQRPA